jgi:hypothetical protein
VGRTIFSQPLSALDVVAALLGLAVSTALVMIQRDVAALNVLVVVPPVAFVLLGRRLFPPSERDEPRPPTGHNAWTVLLVVLGAVLLVLGAGLALLVMRYPAAPRSGLVAAVGMVVAGAVVAAIGWFVARWRRRRAA